MRAKKIPGDHKLQLGVTLQQQPIARIDYNAKGQKRNRVDRGNGTVTKYGYDPETFRLRELRTTRPGYNPSFPDARGQLSDARVLQDLHYGYDAVGNITDIYDDAWTPAFFSNHKPRGGLHVDDAVYRLIQATGRENGAASGVPPQFTSAPTGITNLPISSATGALKNYIQRYRYDAVGNMQTMRHGPTAGWTRNYTYASDSNRSTASNTDNPAKAVAYDYDPHGSMSNLNAVPEQFELRWGWNDMIQTINLGGGGRAWYQYGSDNAAES